MRVAAAPISWGVCEVPGWGHQLPPERVLAEMAGLGLTATELGPEGFLPADGTGRRAVLDAHGLTAVGGFVPVVLHEPGYDPVPEVRAMLAGFGAPTLVLAAATGREGYEGRPALDGDGWHVLLSNLDRLAEVAAAAGFTATLHPHAGTMVAEPSDVDRVLEGSAIPLCLDTGHVLVGGGDPVALARTAAGRIRHVHLKDADAATVRRVRGGELSYRDGVAAGLYRPLGAGDAGVAEVVGALRDAGYDGWYVLEQDVVLDGPGARPAEQVRQSLEYLRARL